ncbi:DUF4157 domain-containing protein [uncultured Sunxiuqinia sp.]|uniref:eCIS core domain-containing protein n=1 Tax=uncultured Sunxiuqinia sp. TaxID=1573825 RepID=UPI0030D7B66F
MKKDTTNSKKMESRAVANADHSVKKKRNANLPEDLQTRIETSFGQDFSDVALQKNSIEAREMNALAFTQSEKIHFAPGQFNPNTEKGRNLIGHEFTHIAQQRSGVVKPTRVLRKRFTVNDDRGLEADAERFGRKAVRGETISKYQSASLGMRNSMRTVQAKSSVIQMAKQSTHFGEFIDESYTTIKNSGGKEIGVDMYMKFKPGNKVDAKLIGMVQSVRSVDKGKPVSLNTTVKDRSITSKDAKTISSPVIGTDEAVHIDQADYNRNPLYAVEKASKSDTKLSQGATPSSVSKMTAAELAASTVTGKNYKGWGEHGYRYKSGKAWKSKDAELHDAPMQPGRSKNAEQLFETTALAIDGTQKGTYYGSVQWGWRTDSKAKFSRIPFAVQSQGTPSSTFLKAAEIWNTTKTSKGESSLNLPVEDVKWINNIMGVDIGLGPLYTHLPWGTRVVVLPGFAPFGSSLIKVVDGPFTGETGEVEDRYLLDERP